MPPQDLAWIAPAFAVFWLVLTGALSHLSGWHELAKRFRSDDSIEGRRFRFRSAAIGWPYFPVSYGGSLFATVGPRGFTLSIFFLYRFLHPPLLIPWTEIERCEPTRRWLRTYTAISIKNFRRRLMFPGGLGEKLLSTWNQARTPA